MVSQGAVASLGVNSTEAALRHDGAGGQDGHGVLEASFWSSPPGQPPRPDTTHRSRTSTRILMRDIWLATTRASCSRRPPLRALSSRAKSRRPRSGGSTSSRRTGRTLGARFGGVQLHTCARARRRRPPNKCTYPCPQVPTQVSAQTCIHFQRCTRGSMHALEHRVLAGQ